MLISVIVPVYNGSRDILRCIKSVLNQTYTNFELIVVDDKSTDDTIEVIKTIKDERIVLIEKNENGGQGESRNIGIKISQGEYITFLDADDILKPYALSELLKAKGNRHADIVFGDWYYYKKEEDRKMPSNLWWLFNKKIINETNKGSLLVIPNFPVAKLYNKDFLIKNNLSFGEGYIYEDHVFYVGAIIKAQIISLCEKLIYEVMVQDGSTTRSNLNGDFHANSFIKATEEIYKRYGDSLIQYLPNYMTYSVNRGFLYSDLRMPKRIKYNFLNKLVDIHENHGLKKISKKDVSKLKEIRYILFSKKVNRVLRILAYELFLKKNKIPTLAKWYPNVKSVVINFDNKRKTLLSKVRKSSVDKYKNIYLSEDVVAGNVVLYGFDYKCVGNTKYLIEDIIDSGVFKKIYTVGFYHDGCIQLNRDTDNFYKAVATAKFHIMESWTPLNVVKRKDSIWIQLWHGTPLKKVLLDSPESEIISKAPKHKLNKLKDIFRWDYILSQGSFSTEKFQTCFGLSEDQILSFGYPRTDILYDKKQHELIITKVRNFLGLNHNKKIIFYAPTWRDINYGKKKRDNSYLLGHDFFSELDDDYIILFRGHPYHRDSIDFSEKIIDVSDYSDIQELLIVSDFLISDYSSVLVDYLILNKPFALYCTDLKEFERTRGIYNEYFTYFENYIFKDSGELIDYIRASNFDEKVNNSCPFINYENPSSSLKLLDFIKKNQ